MTKIPIYDNDNNAVDDNDDKSDGNDNDENSGDHQDDNDDDNDNPTYATDNWTLEGQQRFNDLQRRNIQRKDVTDQQVLRGIVSITD